MDAFINRMTDFLIERKQDAISTLNKNNTEYADLRQTINKDIAQGFEHIKEKIYRLHDIESDFLYLQGFKDCIMLLRLIEIL